MFFQVRYGIHGTGDEESWDLCGTLPKATAFSFAWYVSIQDNEHHFMEEVEEVKEVEEGEEVEEMENRRHKSHHSFLFIIGFLCIIFHF